MIVIALHTYWCISSNEANHFVAYFYAYFDGHIMMTLHSTWVSAALFDIIAMLALKLMVKCWRQRVSVQLEWDQMLTVNISRQSDDTFLFN